MLLSSNRRETAMSRCPTRRLRRCPRRSRCCCKAGRGRAGMVCEHHPSPRPRPKSQAAGRAPAPAPARARAVWPRSPSAPPPCARASPPAPWAGQPCHTPVASSWRRGSLRSIPQHLCSSLLEEPQEQLLLFGTPLDAVREQRYGPSRSDYQAIGEGYDRFGSLARSRPTVEIRDEDCLSLVQKCQYGLRVTPLSPCILYTVHGNSLLSRLDPRTKTRRPLHRHTDTLSGSELPFFAECPLTPPDTLPPLSAPTTPVWELCSPWPLPYSCCRTVYLAAPKTPLRKGGATLGSRAGLTA